MQELEIFGPLPLAAAQPQRAFHVGRGARERYGLSAELFALHGKLILADLGEAKRLAMRINDVRDTARYPEAAVKAGDLYAAGLLHELLHLAVAVYRERLAPDLPTKLGSALDQSVEGERLRRSLLRFVESFPPARVYRGEEEAPAYLAGRTEGVPHRYLVLEEMLLLWLSNENPAYTRLSDLIDDAPLRAETAYLELIEGFRTVLEEGPAMGPAGQSLFEMLRAPARHSPTSLEGQLRYIEANWPALLGDRLAPLMKRILTTLDTLKEEQKGGQPGGPGPSRVPDGAALRGEGIYRASMPVEYERFSPDSSWMPSVVLLAKSTYVWLDQLARQYGREVNRLDQVPDEALDEMARRGFTGLWLIGLWERSEASRRVKHIRGNPDAVASAYALYDYVIADDLGGEAAYEDLRSRAGRRGIRLASDMVPNHVGIDGRWVIQHPDWFIQLDHSPYPGYSFNGPDLSPDERVGIFLEDHYYDNSDAAVVFKRLDRHTGDARYIYHGNDGTTIPWNDTAQLDYLKAEVREAVIQTILHVARKFPIIRFDAAMTLAKQHIQRLWFPEPGQGGAIPSRAEYGSMSVEEFDRHIPDEFWREVVDRVALEVPDTLLLAEAFWMMEGYFVRTLGMHRVYNSAFMNMFKDEENAKYRQFMKNVLEFEPEILRRFVNFMNNPDEETAEAQFGKHDKYFGVCTMLATMPGLPMFGHGQVEGYTEKYGMEYRRAKLDEQPDPGLVERHRREIFPLLHRRAQFAEVENFQLYDLHAPEGHVNEDVFAYSNSVGDRASLVVFNNRFAEAKGWIRQAAPYSQKTGQGEGRQTVHRTLGDGLRLRADPQDFVIFREHTTGLEFLRRSRDLAHEGMYLELGAFKYQVYLDFREVADNEYGHFARLHGELGGRGVPDVTDALEEVRLRPLHEAFGLVLDADNLSELEEGRFEPSRFETAQRDFLLTTERFGGEPPSPEQEKAFAETARALRDFRGLEPAKARDKALARRLEPGLADKVVLLAWAALRGTGEADTRYRRWRLDRPVRDALMELGSTEGEARERAELVTYLLRYGDWLARAAAAGDAPSAALLSRWLADDEVLGFLRVNTHEGERWFNREAYRLLTDGLLRLALFERHLNGEPGAEMILEAARALEAAEATSGYRLEKLLGAAGESPPGATGRPAAKSSRAAKTTGRDGESGRSGPKKQEQSSGRPSKGRGARRKDTGAKDRASKDAKADSTKGGAKK